MTQYIGKDTLVVEIEKLLDKREYHEGYDCGFRDGNNYALYELKEKIDILEVKEVDLEKELDDYVYQEGLVNCYEIAPIAKHFFELGLRAQKEE